MKKKKSEAKIILDIINEASKKYVVVSRYGTWNRKKQRWE